jgi:hypothetical protein
MQFEDRVKAVANFGFTERQARFLATVMLHSGVCLLRQYTAFAGIVHGEKTKRFFAKLVRLRYASAYPCRHNRGRIYQVHQKALYRAIDETDSRHRRPLSPARVVERLMLLDAVLVDPDLIWLATDEDKAAHITALTPIDHERLPHLGMGKTPSESSRSFAEKFPIGIDLKGRAVVLYLATDSEQGRFRAFLHRHFELLRSLPAWTLRIVVPPWPEGLGEPFLKTAHEEFTVTFRPVVLKDLRWYFTERRNVVAKGYETPDQEAFDVAKRAFRAPRFEALYRRWLADGDCAFDLVSDGLKDAVERGAGRIEHVVLPHSYRHLFPLVACTIRKRKGAEERDETRTRPRPLPHASEFDGLSVAGARADQSTSTFQAIAP